jgi:hypothetical protein
VKPELAVAEGADRLPIDLDVGDEQYIFVLPPGQRYAPLPITGAAAVPMGGRPAIGGCRVATPGV